MFPDGIFLFQNVVEQGLKISSSHFLEHHVKRDFSGHILVLKTLSQLISRVFMVACLEKGTHALYFIHFH
jgi:hypothetical protein